jgi:hypothetical protein
MDYESNSREVGDKDEAVRTSYRSKDNSQYGI